MDHSQLKTDHSQLKMDHSQLKTIHSQLKTDHSQLKTIHSQLKTIRSCPRIPGKICGFAPAFASQTPGWKAGVLPRGLQDGKNLRQGLGFGLGRSKTWNDCSLYGNFVQLPFS
jgi:hypothetical protein